MSQKVFISCDTTVNTLNSIYRRSNLSIDKKKEKIFIGKIFGTIIWPPRGNLGFGYDPIFIPKGRSLTFAQMKPSEKHRIDHRYLAFKKV